MCHVQIPRGAKKCAHCSSDLRSWPQRHPILAGLLALFLFSFIVGKLVDTDSGGASGRTTASAEPVLQVSAADLMADYERNEIAADALYKGNVIEVDGRVGSIGNDILDNPFVTLKTAGALWSVQCMLQSSQASRAATLVEDMPITVVGRVSGKLGNVLLRDCRIR